MKANPYSFGFPIAGGDNFVGRRDILTELFSDLQSDKLSAMVSLYGARNIGTTSLLMAIVDKKLQQQFGVQSSSKWKFLFFDLKELTKVTPDSVTTAFLQRLGAETGKEFRKTGEHFADLRRATEEFQASGDKLIILLDEADRLVELESEYVFMDLFFYALLNTPGSTINMITASKRPLYELFALCQERFGEDIGSPYYLHFRPMKIGLFSSAEMHELVVTVSMRAGLSLSEDYNKIVRLGGRFPMFLQIASHLTFEIKKRKGQLARLDWREMSKNFEARALPYYSYFWDNFTSLEREIISQIAVRGASNILPVKSSELQFEFNAKRLQEYNGFMETYSHNQEMRRGIRSGGFRSGELSEWLWTLVHEGKQRTELFSKSFRRFVLAHPQNKSLSTRTAATNILKVLYSNLRKHFDNAAPSSETEVQRAVQLILDASGYDFNREGSQFVFGVKGWRPDHSSDQGIAIEVKLSRSKQDVKRITEEISADIIPYRSKFAILIVVVYDLGSINDEIAFRTDFEKLDGVYVLIRKH